MPIAMWKFPSDAPGHISHDPLLGHVIQINDVSPVLLLLLLLPSGLLGLLANDEEPPLGILRCSSLDHRSDPALHWLPDWLRVWIVEVLSAIKLPFFSLNERILGITV